MAAVMLAWVAAQACTRDRAEPEAVRPRSLVAPEPPSLVRPLSAPLRAYLLAIPRMGQESHAYRPPGARVLDWTRLAFAQLAAGREQSASLLFGTCGLEVLELRQDGQRYFVVREPADRAIRGWGAYVINPNPRREIVLQAPHPQNDLYTDEQAIDLFIELGARALMLSTSYRCATTEWSDCSGRTRACGGKRRRERFRVSDMSHTDRSVFQAAHEAFYESSREIVVIQIHGFDRRPDRRIHLIVSDGTRRRSPRSALSNRLARALRRRIRRRRSAMSCNAYLGRSLPPLCGTLCVQGRHANGSPDPCRKRAKKSTGRFIHIEQSIDARRIGGRVEPRMLAQALAELF
jgi:hypothetical protein